ncbi:hypothetical protein [Erwinia amylovora]|uniref:Uncharacterized protein n=1 Tax=Erwinia amylovora TaxID=552 RepID=A0ABX7MIU5_ERWAM|nr:hypothetical protein [Erwinia amylovora]CDK14229.1 putative membrane protein [Erwinia amylovora LA635]CDK17596.1 hypothetical protein LA636_0604 [Erwinia amylovora LA636]CDK20965.1 putative membrane protein [Erwinia amylovora LA637]MBZ2390412.1 hypothetical protein [Erwinia amylovora]MBZ2395094.1 hypothetical protein [Erwinia amylovora]
MIICRFVLAHRLAVLKVRQSFLLLLAKILLFWQKAILYPHLISWCSKAASQHFSRII